MSDEEKKSESAYKEGETGRTDQWPNFAKNEKGTAVEPSEPQEKKEYYGDCCPLCGQIVHPVKIRYLTRWYCENDDCLNCNPVKIHAKIDPVSAPSESQEEMWKKHCEQEALWDSAMQIGNSEKTYKAAIHKIMKYFSITRKPE